VSNKVQAIRGMNDILPEDINKWHHLENSFSRILQQYGYSEIRFPMVESTQLFKRSIGEVTDIVEKEMYTFNDLNGDSLTLRPEGTASCVRSCIQHGLLHNQQQKLWYYGPMFRHERPQQGRYRQFYQIGVEALGITGVGIELELIAMCKRLWHILGIDEHVSLEVNSLGSIEERNAYREQLVAYFNEHFDVLDDDSKRRLSKNPLRILDSKNPTMKDLISNAPKLLDALNEDSEQHFNAFCQGLDYLGINYTVNQSLVRGLDYYGQTVFEWVTDKLGSQSTVCAGGRYDALVEQIGGKHTPAVGLAMGAERLLLLIDKVAADRVVELTPDVYVITDGADTTLNFGLLLAEQLRTTFNQLDIHVNTSGGSFKSQFKKADKSGARLALILGSEEVSKQVVGVKDLRSKQEQQSIPQAELEDFLHSYLQ
jgi:histidyl-tRNA synthetase